jgi:hypothetical protein
MDSTPIKEADLLKMPAKQYMNQVQLAFFRNRLLALKREVAQNASATSDNLRSTELRPTHPTGQHRRRSTPSSCAFGIVSASCCARSIKRWRALTKAAMATARKRASR